MVCRCSATAAVAVPRGGRPGAPLGSALCRCCAELPGRVAVVHRTGAVRSLGGALSSAQYLCCEPPTHHLVDRSRQLPSTGAVSCPADPNGFDISAGFGQEGQH